MSRQVDIAAQTSNGINEMSDLVAAESTGRHLVRTRPSSVKSSALPGCSQYLTEYDRRMFVGKFERSGSPPTNPREGPSFPMAGFGKLCWRIESTKIRKIVTLCHRESRVT
jgi:hypothetical protein